MFVTPSTLLPGHVSWLLSAHIRKHKHLCRLFEWSHDGASPLLVYKDRTLLQTIASQEGVQQGHVLGSLGYNMSIHPDYAAVQDEYKEVMMFVWLLFMMTLPLLVQLMLLLLPSTCSRTVLLLVVTCNFVLISVVSSSQRLMQLLSVTSLHKADISRYVCCSWCHESAWWLCWY